MRANRMLCVVVGEEKRHGGFGGRHSSPSLELVVLHHWSFESPLSLIGRLLPYKLRPLIPPPSTFVYR